MNRAILCFAARALAVLVPFGVVAGVGCSDDDPPENVVDAGVALTDPEIAAVVSALNSGEVAQADLALSRAQTSAARDYATKMATEHQAAIDRMNTLIGQLGITPVGSSTSQRVETDANGIMSTLQSASDADFDSSYIASQVIMHTMALELLDQRLIPSAQIPELRTELQLEREAVAMHLQEAESLMMGTPDAGPTQEAGPGDAL